jgi:hypothetical protein
MQTALATGRSTIDSTARYTLWFHVPPESNCRIHRRRSRRRSSAERAATTMPRVNLGLLRPPPREMRVSGRSENAGWCNPRWQDGSGPPARCRVQAFAWRDTGSEFRNRSAAAIRQLQGAVPGREAGNMSQRRVVPAADPYLMDRTLGAAWLLLGPGAESSASARPFVRPSMKHEETRTAFLTGPSQAREAAVTAGGGPGGRSHRAARAFPQAGPTRRRWRSGATPSGR